MAMHYKVNVEVVYHVQVEVEAANSREACSIAEAGVARAVPPAIQLEVPGASKPASLTLWDACPLPEWVAEVPEPTDEVA